ncbi:MAG TPA: lysylphosphatidylglycerol synthase domain-containing protein [Solirubrobacteraceae bacterium]|nr:lysylphosphatidylglycerol synthase domain-containing protein [Solirubrobacteraceae bacterium]
MRRLLARRIITLALLSIGGITLLLAVPGLQDVVAELRQVTGLWVIAALGLEIASCVSYVIVFRRFFEDLPPRLGRKVAWTEMGSGALLPGGGAGSLAVGGWLLHLAGMPTRQIVKRSSGLFFLTSAVNVAALIAGGVLLFAEQPRGLSVLPLSVPPVALGFLALGATLALPPLVARRPPRRRPRPWFDELVDGVRVAENALRHPTWREAGAVGYLAFDIAVLAATLAAVGYAPPLPVLLLGYIVGYLANLIPVPGGVGVLEGGLTGTLILYGAPPVQAAAGVLVYHAIAFWIPSLGGLWAYARLRRDLAGPTARRSPDRWPDRVLTG